MVYFYEDVSEGLYFKRMGGGGKKKDILMKNIGIKHETNYLKLQTNKKQTSNNMHEQPTLKLDKSQATKTQQQAGCGGLLGNRVDFRLFCFREISFV